MPGPVSSDERAAILDMFAKDAPIAPAERASILAMFEGGPGTAPAHVDNDASYQLPGQYVTRDNESVRASVKAGAYGGSMERVARSMLGANASQRDINNYVGQLLEINAINDPRRVQAGQDILLPDAGTPAATKGLAIYGKDIALGEQMKVVAAQAQRERWDAMQTGAWSGRTDPGGPVWHVGGASVADVTRPIDVRGVIDKANSLAYSDGLTREQLLGALGEVRAAMGSAGTHEHQLWLQGAALSLHGAGASRGLMRPGETVSSPEMAGIGVASMAFGGSSGSAPTGISPTTGYAGPTFRSAFRAFNASNEAVTFSNRFPEDAVQLRPVPTLTPEQALRMPKNVLYVVREDGGLVVAPRPKDFSYGHVDLARGEKVLAAGEGKILWGEVKFIDNASGHYLPQGPAAQSAAVKAFADYGFKVPSGAYQEKVYDFNLGRWVAK